MSQAVGVAAPVDRVRRFGDDRLEGSRPQWRFQQGVAWAVSNFFVLMSCRNMLMRPVVRGAVLTSLPKSPAYVFLAEHLGELQSSIRSRRRGRTPYLLPSLPTTVILATARRLPGGVKNSPQTCPTRGVHGHQVLVSVHRNVNVWSGNSLPRSSPLWFSSLTQPLVAPCDGLAELGAIDVRSSNRPLMSSSNRRRVAEPSIIFSLNTRARVSFRFSSLRRACGRWRTPRSGWM